MADLQIDDLLQGVATGAFPQRVGSQFGSVWGWDGLMASEASANEYAAFGAPSEIKLAHGQPVSWLGCEWSAILTYKREKLEQINIHTNGNDSTLCVVRGRLEKILGNGQDLSFPQDVSQPVSRRFAWDGRGGVVSLVLTQTYLQISIGPIGSPGSTSGCLGILLVVTSGMSFATMFI